jgi:hypothetical protein
MDEKWEAIGLVIYWGCMGFIVAILLNWYWG